MKIKNMVAREILDSRGNPTIEVDVILENGKMARASVPSGASTGDREALELRDNDDRYDGKGVQKAVANVAILKEHLIGMDVTLQKEIDQKMIMLDGTENKSKYGANAILGISMAVLKAAALSKEMPLYRYLNRELTLPVPMINIVNGGMHADNSLDFQEYMIVPMQDTFKEKIRVSAEVFHTLKNLLKSKGMSTAVGDEGGFAPDLGSNEEALSLIIEAITKAGYVPGVDVKLAMDVAASEFYENGYYNLASENKKLTTKELIEYYQYLIDKYPIISIEDPVDQDDFEGFHLITKMIGDQIQLVGDDLFVTNIRDLKKGIAMNAGNAILIKLNQIGTVTEAMETIALARANGYKTIISHRSGETEDTTIAHLAIGLGQIKTGSVSRTERVAKYNELIRIEEEILGES